MSLKVYQLYCEVCNWKMITDGTEVENRLYELKTSPVPRGMPQLDPVEKQIIVKKPQKQPRKFRCPQCGRVVIPKQIENPQEEINVKNEIKNRKSHEKDWADGRKERTQGSEIPGITSARVDE